MVYLKAFQFFRRSPRKEEGSFEVLVDKLYDFDCPHCSHVELAEPVITINADVVEKALLNIYNKKVNVKKQIEPGLFNETIFNLNKQSSRNWYY